LPPPLHLSPMRPQVLPTGHLPAPGEPGFPLYVCPLEARAALEYACPCSQGYDMPGWLASPSLRMALPCRGADRRGRVSCPLLSSPSPWPVFFRIACNAMVGVDPSTPSRPRESGTEPRMTEPRKTEPRKTERRMTEPRMTEHRKGPNIERPNLEWDRTSKD
jgi:hypothetical protein